MAWFPGAQRVTNPYVGRAGSLDPVAVICHRTYGRFAGDMAVMQGSRKGIAFHFYVTKDGRTFQTEPGSTARMAHCKGANDWSIGIEVESLNNDDPMTAPQMRALGQLVGWISRTHAIPMVYDPGPTRKGKRAGFLAHASIAGSDHGDRWTRAEWEQIVRNVRGVEPVPPPVEEQGDALMALIKYGDNQLHAFDVVDGQLMHRWFDPGMNKWLSEVLAGVKAAASLNRDPVTNPLVAAAKYGEQLHVTAGRTHAWFDPASRRWYSELLP